MMEKKAIAPQRELWIPRIILFKNFTKSISLYYSIVVKLIRTKYDKMNEKRTDFWMYYQKERREGERKRERKSISFLFAWTLLCSSLSVSFVLNHTFFFLFFSFGFDFSQYIENAKSDRWLLVRIFEFAKRLLSRDIRIYLTVCAVKTPKTYVRFYWAWHFTFFHVMLR